jgi:hypothetical protein
MSHNLWSIGAINERKHVAERNGLLERTRAPHRLIFGHILKIFLTLLTSFGRAESSITTTSTKVLTAITT